MTSNLNSAPWVDDDDLDYFNGLLSLLGALIIFEYFMLPLSINFNISIYTLW